MLTSNRFTSPWEDRTYAGKREVVRVATGKVEVLAIELELFPFDRHETLGSLALAR